jgi:hypothetical protein
MKKSGLSLALILVLIFGVIASGCLGGDNIKEKASSAIESYTEEHSSTEGSGESSGCLLYTSPSPRD